MCHLDSCKSPLCPLSWLQRQYRRSGSAIWITLTFSSASLGPKQFYVEPGRVLYTGPQCGIAPVCFYSSKTRWTRSLFARQVSPTPFLAAGWCYPLLASWLDHRSQISAHLLEVLLRTWAWFQNPHGKNQLLQVVLWTHIGMCEAHMHTTATPSIISFKKKRQNNLIVFSYSQLWRSLP